MFKVDVISDPVSALSTDGRLWGAEAKRLAERDVALVKPALLFADHVELVSFRIDMQTINDSDTIVHAKMPMRIAGSFAGASLRRDPEELELLGISESDLCTADEARGYFEGRSEPYENLVRFSDVHFEKIGNYRLAVLSVLKERRDGLISPELNLAVSRGFLTCSGWSIDPMSPRELLWSPDVDDFVSDAMMDLVERVAQSVGTPLIEPGAQSVLASMMDGSIEVPGQGTPTFAQLPVEIGSSFVARLPGLSALKVDELLDLRSSLKDHLPAFRAEVTSLAEEIDAEAGASLSDLKTEIDKRWHRDIAPVFLEIKEEVRSASYPRSLLNAFSADAAAMTGAATSIAFAAGSVVAGAGALVPAAAAATFPFIRALSETVRARSELRKNRLYFLYGAHAHLSKRNRI